MPDAGEAIHVRQFNSELLSIVRLRSKSSRVHREKELWCEHWAKLPAGECGGKDQVNWGSLKMNNFILDDILWQEFDTNDFD